MSKVIDAIKFGLLSPDETRRLSVVEIGTSDTYDEDGAPIAGGLMDQRLGTLEPRQRCRTCGNIAINCPGHFGHIELAVPVVHVEFAKQIYRVLSATCRSCGSVLLDEEKRETLTEQRNKDIELFGKVNDETSKEIMKQAKKFKRYKECPYCGMVQNVVKFNKPTTFIEVEKEVFEEEMEDEVNRLREYRDKLINEITARIRRCFLNGHPTERLPNNVHFRFEGIEGESLLLSLKDMGISASTGSACSSKTLEPSHTLIALGLLHEEAHGSLEFTLGRFNTEEDCDRVIEALPPVVERLRRLSPLYKEETS